MASAIAAGGRHGCAIQAGTRAVICWFFGDALHYYGEATPPPAVNGVSGTASAISAGRFHSCAIQTGTGAVVCWGNNANGESTPPPSVDGSEGTASAIAAGDNYSCAIQAGTGAVICWGWDYYGQATPPPSVNGWTGSASAIVAGYGHSCAIQAGTGAVVCWGDNAGGQSTPPASVDGRAGTASAIAAGSGHSCAIQVGTGAVVCWGEKYGGQSTPPASVDGRAGTASAIAAGSGHSCAIQSGSGGVVCWGDSFYGPPKPPPSVDGSAGKASAIGVAIFYALAIHAPECSDGLDADADGLVDHPADPGCDSPDDYSERSAALACDDGLDNDADREIDYPADPGCDSPTDGSERGPASVCDDGSDDDGDGLADYPDDRGCDSSRDETETSPTLVCDDGVDNDGDGRIDYPDDRNCTSAEDRSEDPEQCDDRLDNDRNGLVDYPADPSCSDYNDRSERTTPVFEVVKDGLDLGNPLALTVGDDGRVYGGTVYPIGPVVVYNVFQVDHGIYTPLASLPLEVELDLRGFVRGSDGAYYGIEQRYCPECSIYDVVKITSDGVRTTLLTNAYPNFDLRFDPFNGEFTLLPFAAADGSVYGLRAGAGLYGPGDLVRYRDGTWSFVDGPGTFSLLRELIAAGWRSNLALGGDDSIYGVGVRANDPNVNGGVYRIDDAGTPTMLHVFSGYGPDGAYPIAPLTLGGDGAMYGVTQFGGGAGPSTAGTVFRVDRDGNFTSLHAFDYTDGSQPEQPLVQTRNGVLYGVTSFGIPGASVFLIDGGTVTSFPILPFHPFSALVQGNDCALYGLADAWVDGKGSQGLVYRVFEPGTLCQETDFAPLPDRTLGDEPFTLSATSSSGLPVSFTASGSCTVTGDQVTLTGVGLCTLTASQAGDASYEAAEDVSQSFHVFFDFDGFLPPVMNLPVVNRVKAGRAVPIRFSLGGDQGRDVLAEGTPDVRPVACDASASVNDIGNRATGHTSSLHYAPKRGRYTYLWKTDPSWAGSCQELSLELSDGSVHRATFRFERLPSPGGLGDEH